MPRILPEIVPYSRRRARYRRASLITVVLINLGIAVHIEFFGWVKPDGMSYVADGFIFAINVGVVHYGWRAHDGFLVRPARPVRLVRPLRFLRRGGGGAAHGRGPAARVTSGPVIAGRWPALRPVSRLMPGPMGRRWLAEAQSLLAEADAGQRRAAARSYLRSAPRLILIMWLAELSRRARRHLR
jgi:hypothetical protein